VAEILVQRGVPIVIHSARKAAASDSHLVFLKGIWICKPSDPQDLVAAVEVSLQGSCIFAAWQADGQTDIQNLGRRPSGHRYAD
jgi:DNA-binding response OmpR family regulator